MIDDVDEASAYETSQHCPQRRRVDEVGADATEGSPSSHQVDGCNHPYEAEGSVPGDHPIGARVKVDEVGAYRYLYQGGLSVPQLKGNKVIRETCFKSAKRRGHADSMVRPRTCQTSRACHPVSDLQTAGESGMSCCARPLLARIFPLKLDV